jgi:diguanylate cyclase (GGDEF)-like protein
VASQGARRRRRSNRTGDAAGRRRRPGRRRGRSGGGGGIQIIALINFAGALLAFFLAARAITLDRRALRTHRGSWIVLVITTALLAAVLGVGLFLDLRSDRTVLLWASTLLETALVVSLNLGCFFLYVREHERVAQLYDTAETHSVRSRRLEAILALSDTLRTVRDVQGVVDIAAGAVKETLAFRECALYLYDEEADVLNTRAALGGDDAYNEVILERPIPGSIGRGVLREEFRHGSVYFIDHTRYAWTEDELLYFPPGDFEERVPGGFHRDDALFVPLRDTDGQMLGLFDLYDPEDGCVPSDEALQVLEIFANVTASSLENARYAAELEVRAVTDGLTGLYNHRHFQETLAHEVDRAARYGLVFALLMMDLDLFKNVNDRLGHPRGDEVLKSVADVVRGNARTSDFAARYGGEEFVMILPGTSAKQAAALAERIAQGVRDIALDVPDPPRISISIGMADYPACGRDRESLISAADAALLFAKRAGRDMIADFSEMSLVEFDQSALEGLAFRLEKADIETIETLAAAIDMRDAFGKERARDVAASADWVATELGLDDTERSMLHMAALVYDIGKVGIPVDVLNRRGDLSEQERVAIRRHPEVGKRLLESVTRLNALAPVVLHHHERWDGTGYPDGLEGEEIPFAARVIALCDAWQAMVSERPYRPALSPDAAVAELRAGAGQQFDPGLVEVFIAGMQKTAGAAG